MRCQVSAETFVFCPTFQVNGKDQVRPETLASIKDLQGSIDFELGRYNPFKESYYNILNQYQVARQKAIHGGYKYLLTIEHDMLIPADALPKMIDCKAPVVYGLYVLRHGARVLNAWRKVESNYVGMSLSLFPDELAEARAKVVAEVSGVGFGCMLVDCQVFDDIEFKASSGAISSAIPDIPFATQCLRKGYKQVCHFGIECGHIEPSGNILWPSENEVNMLKVYKVLQDVNINVGGLTVALEAGAEVPLPVEVGQEQARAGYLLETKKKPPKEKVIPKPAIKKAADKKAEAAEIAAAEAAESKGGLNTESLKGK